VNTSSSCGWWEPIHAVVLSHQTQDFPTETQTNLQIWNTKWLETQESGHRNSIIKAPLVSQHIAKFPKEGSHHPPFSSWETKKELAKLSNDIPQIIQILNNFPIGRVERSKELAKLSTDIPQIIRTWNIFQIGHIERSKELAKLSTDIPQIIRTLNIFQIGPIKRSKELVK
jgi:hypothetical protein